MAAFAAKDEHVAAERIGADDLLHLGRQAVEPGTQIDRLASEKDLCSRRQADHPSLLTADSTRRSAFSLTPLSTRTRTPSGEIDLDYPNALHQCQAGAARGYRAGRYWHHRALARCVGDDTKMNEFRRPDRSGSRCQTSGLPCRSPIVKQALRDPVPLGNDRNLTALGLHFGHQRRLFLRRPLPAARNHDLAIHSTHSFWTVQKDLASPSTLLSATASRPVQTGRLRLAGHYTR